MNMIKYKEIPILLTAIFLLYVIGDYFTTIIAIDVSPLGINGEINPIAVTLYKNYGMNSLLVVKLIMFLLLLIVTMIILKRNINTRYMVKKVLLSFIVFSSIVVGINIYSILTA
ncbi:MAG: hypothetical protein QW416_05230 [Candidatus Nitrosocaldaceae archaeon]